MNETNRLDRIVDALAKVMKAAPSSLPEGHFYHDGKPSAKILEEIEELDARMESCKHSADDRIHRCEEILNAAHRDPSDMLVTLEELAPLLTRVYSDRDLLERDNSHRNALLYAYDRKMAQETGFADIDAVLAKQRELTDEQQAIRQMFLGRLRSRKRMGEIRTEYDRLSELFSRWMKPQNILGSENSLYVGHLTSDMWFVVKNVLAEGYKALAAADKRYAAVPEEYLISDSDVTSFLDLVDAWREDMKKRVMVITWNGEPDKKTEEWVTRPDSRGRIDYVPEEILWVDVHKMPAIPRPSIKSVFVNCRPAMYFQDKEGHYDHLMLTRIVWDAHGEIYGTHPEESFRKRPF
jgi:hypothetical protein